VSTLFDLGERVALITGGTRGLGRAMALGLAQAGADLVIASRHQDACDEAAAALREQTGRRVLGKACHVGRWDEIDALVDAAYAEYGRVDVLINNAGMSPVYPSPEAVSEELWDKVLAVNLKGPFRLTALVGARMAAGNGGAVINVSSVAAIRPDGAVLPYAAAKAGLNALTVGFAEALGPKVRVNAILAGTFLTDISTHWDPEWLRERSGQFALGRAGEPDEIVGTALYLASPASSYTSGAVIPVHGGHP
jgi:NAD(P)-dependent dehydrogenase (short-subunit alcohol dehydrogenase family)